MNKKQKNAQEVAYLRKINKERIKINEQLNNTLTELVRKGENLENYKILVNEKYNIMIQPDYIIEKVSKNLEKEGFTHDAVYVIVKKLQKRKRGKMKQLFYEKVTIENIQNLVKTGYVTEIVCDGDNKTINIKEEELLKIEQIFNEIADSLKPVVDAICEIGKKICDIFNSIFDNFKCMSNKKISKRKFMKLLQSEGIQRNTINEIVKNNTKPYTYARYYEILIKFSKDERKEKFYV